MTWQDKRVTHLTLTAQKPCTVTLLANGQQQTLKLKKGRFMINPKK
jgi:alpha-L-fucosidase 2